MRIFSGEQGTFFWLRNFPVTGTQLPVLDVQDVQVRFVVAAQPESGPGGRVPLLGRISCGTALATDWLGSDFRPL